MERTLAIIPLAFLSLAGCATTSQKGPGFVDPRMAAAAQAESATEMELDLDVGGAIVKVAVEQTDASAAPEAVKRLAQTTWPGSTPTKYEREIYEGGAVVHEVAVKTADGKECEVSATEAGALRYTECELTPGDMPVPVGKTVGETVAGGEVKEVEVRKSDGGEEEWRVEVKQGGRTFYLRIRPDGALISRAIRLEAEVTIPMK
jgi:hypothetical protein